MSETSILSGKPMRLLALDCASVTGWAQNCWVGPVVFGREQFSPRRGEGHAARWLRFRCWVQALLQQLQPDGLIYESPITHHPGAHAAEVAYTLAGLAQVEAEAAGIPYFTIAPSSLKLWAAGSGAADKERMMQAARDRWALGSRALDNNEADALLLLAWGLAGFPEVVSARKAAKKARITP